MQNYDENVFCKKHTLPPKDIHIYMIKQASSQARKQASKQSIKSKQSKSNHIKSQQIKANQIKSNKTHETSTSKGLKHIQSNQIKSHQIKVKSDQIKSSINKTINQPIHHDVLIIRHQSSLYMIQHVLILSSTLRISR